MLLFADNQMAKPRAMVVLPIISPATVARPQSVAAFYVSVVTDRRHPDSAEHIRHLDSPDPQVTRAYYRDCTG